MSRRAKRYLAVLSSWFPYHGKMVIRNDFALVIASQSSHGPFCCMVCGKELCLRGLEIDWCEACDCPRPVAKLFTSNDMTFERDYMPRIFKSTGEKYYA